MKFQLFLCFCIGLVLSHTTAYNDYKTGKIKTLALPNTFLGNNAGVDPCMKMKSTDFRSLLEKQNIRCSGEWCDSSGGFSCSDNAIKGGCYNAMHIISPTISQKEISAVYNRDILGNYAMAYNHWIQGMKTWDIEKIEKSDVLGSSIFNRAKYLVEWCSTRATSPTPTPKYIPTPTPKYIPTSSPLKHTSLYYEWKAGRFQQEDFFQRNTYIGALPHIDPCTPMKKDAYVSLLKKNGITCNGKWCVDGEWKCSWGNSEDCYNLEHIIDTKNSDPEFGPEYKKDIVGNYIFAYGKWNQQNGRLKDWENIKNEKLEIYGDIFGHAWRAVRLCPTTIPAKEEDAPTEMVEDTMNVIAVVFILGIIGFGIGRLYSVPTTEENNELSEDNDELPTEDVLTEPPTSAEIEYANDTSQGVIIDIPDDGNPVE
jgi:hypothetical protein